MKNTIKMAFIILFAYCLTYGCLHCIQAHSNYDPTDLSDQISTQIMRTDGTVDSHRGTMFPILSTGDRLTARIEIPADMNYESPVLCFGCYNCVLRVSYNGETLYEYGSDLRDGGKHIGSVYTCVPFPAEAFGSALILEAEATESHANGELLEVTCLPGIQARYWLIMDHLAETVFLIAILVLSFIMTVILILSDGRKKFIRLALWMLSFLTTTSTYRLASSGMLYSLIGNSTLCSHAEYLLFFLMPIPFLAFCAEFFTDPRSRNTMLVLLCLQTLLFTTATILNYTTSYHYCMFWGIQNAIMAVSIIAVLLQARHVTLYDEHSVSSKCTAGGLYAFFACILLEIVRHYLRKYTLWGPPMLKFDFLFLGIMITSACFTISIFLKLSRVYMETKQKDYFEHLAYTDVMTSLGNRACYYSHIARLRREKTTNFTVFFMDLNNLKHVNDQYGHEYGDLYIKSAAKAIATVFQSADATYRIGGDEFVAIYTKPLEKDPGSLCQELRTVFAQICKSRGFSFHGSIACGYSVSFPDSPMDVEYAVKQADSRMYEDKAQSGESKPRRKT